MDDLIQRDACPVPGVAFVHSGRMPKYQNAAWLNNAVQFWILPAERPATFNRKSSELRAVLAETTAMTDRVTHQLNTLMGFTVTNQLHGGRGRRVGGRGHASSGVDGGHSFHTFFTVMGTGVISNTGFEQM